MRIAALLALILAGSAAAAAQDAEDIRNSPIHEGPEPRTCPERGAFGFCFYDNGWRPAADNRAFQPLLHRDLRDDITPPLCTITNRRDATLGEYGEDTGPIMRINGRRIHFMSAGGVADSWQRFRAPEGRLLIVDGATVGRAAEWEAHRARITVTDRRGRVFTASVRIGCGV